MKRLILACVLLGTLAACQTTGTPQTYPGYSAGGMCNGGAHCGGYR